MDRLEEEGILEEGQASERVNALYIAPPDVTTLCTLKLTVLPSAL